MPARSSLGDVVPGALLYFRVNGGTTPKAVYTTADLTTQHADPVVADAAGVFPSVFADLGTDDDPNLFSVIATSPTGVQLPRGAYSDVRASISTLYDVNAGATGTGLEWGPFTGDGSDTTFTMAETVAAGMEWTVQVFVAGVLQRPNSYSCNGTTTLTFDTAPPNGARVEGVHVGGSSGITASMPAVRATPSGNLFPIPDRFARFPDIADHQLVLKDGSSDDSAGVAAAFAAQDHWSHFGGTLRIGSDTTIPVGTTLDVTNGQIYVAAGQTLTINGTFNAPPDRHVFTGPGTVLGLFNAYWEWFGAVGDYDESEPDGGDYTDNTAAINKAITCVQAAGSALGAYLRPEARGLDKAYGIDGVVLMAPVLNGGLALSGVGWSPAQTGTRLYSCAGAGQVKVAGTYGLANANSNTNFAIRDLSILISDNPAPIGLLIDGGGGVGNLVITGLVSNLIDNVVIADFAKNCVVRSATKLRLKNCYFNSGTTFGTSLEIGVSTGGTVCSEIALEGTVLGQPGAGAGGGKALAIVNSDISASSAAVTEVRGITLDDDCQLYAGKAGYCIHAFVQAAVGKEKTFGDITLSPGTKLQGAADLSSISAVYIEAKDGAKASTINLFPGQVEAFASKAFDIKATATVATFGDIADVKIQGVTFRYNINESVSVDGASGVLIANNNYQYCGGTVVTATAHILLNNVRAGRVENNLASHKDVTSWPGLNTGVRLTGSATANVYSRANALGTATAYSEHAAVTDANTFDSTDQPSLTVQV